MVDVDRLKEALTYEDDLRNDLGIAWKDAPNAESCFALFDTIVAAARLLVEGQPLWWCEEHEASGSKLLCLRSALSVANDGRPKPCSMVEGVWVPTGYDR